MVNKKLYQEVLAYLRDAVCRKRPELWENQTRMLHHDDALAHASILIHSYLVNKKFYQEVLAYLRDAVCRKRPELWENQTRMLHHDDALAHASILIHSYLAKHQTSVVPYPP